MSKAQKHEAIRLALSEIGYHVRDESGKPLQIVRNIDHAIAEAIAPNFRFRIHDDFKRYIVASAA